MQNAGSKKRKVKNRMGGLQCQKRKRKRIRNRDQSQDKTAKNQISQSHDSQDGVS
jgi:hypothetical protein